MDLVPRYLSEVPNDPFDGKPLRLKHTEDGLVIYSVGLDGDDNGGNLGRGTQLLKPGTDLGAQLWNVKDRRQPYRPESATQEK
jgi:hypothetical protein